MGKIFIKPNKISYFKISIWLLFNLSLTSASAFLTGDTGYSGGGKTGSAKSWKSGCGGANSIFDSWYDWIFSLKYYLFFKIQNVHEILTCFGFGLIGWALIDESLLDRPIILESRARLRWILDSLCLSDASGYENTGLVINRFVWNGFYLRLNLEPLFHQLYFPLEIFKIEKLYLKKRSIIIPSIREP